MKFLFLLFTIFLISIVPISSQNLDLTFTAIDNQEYVQMDSIKIMNRTQESDTVLQWPDTMLTLYYVGLEEKINKARGFHVFQNKPNPITVETSISLFVPERDKVTVLVADMVGRKIILKELNLDKGEHLFRFTPANNGCYLFFARWRDKSSSIKMLCQSITGTKRASLEYSGSNLSVHSHKSTDYILDFPFNTGDELLFVGYANNLQSGILDMPIENTIYIFQFASNIPCPESPSVQYQGKTYNTIQVFSQCWLKENLDVGDMIDAAGDQADNGIIEKYCYNNNPDSCTKYGGLYQWQEAMRYDLQAGNQGICPPGWHIPTDEEWKVLAGAVDSQYGIGDVIWDEWGYNGFDAGTHLKTTSGWLLNGNGDDVFGFSGLPMGLRSNDGNFYGINATGNWWSSSKLFEVIWARYLDCYYTEIGRANISPDYGFSVRCLKD